jgi:hypothetical protein
MSQTWTKAMNVRSGPKMFKFGYFLQPLCVYSGTFCKVLLVFNSQVVKPVSETPSCPSPRVSPARVSNLT